MVTKSEKNFLRSRTHGTSQYGIIIACSGQEKATATDYHPLVKHKLRPARSKGPLAQMVRAVGS